MADFFSRLAERALGVANVARPRKPSVYAPAPSAPFTTAQEEESPALLSPGESTPESPKGRGRLRGPGVMHAERTTLLTSSPEVKSEPPADVHTRPSSTKELPLDPGEEGSRRLSRVNQNLSREQPGRHTSASRAIDTGAPVAIEHTEADSQTHPPDSAKDSRFVGGPRQAGSPEMPLTGSWLESEVGRREMQLRPVVRVTIGRVEVRAVMTSPPPRPSRAPAPKATSLEEHLKQREEARR